MNISQYIYIYMNLGVAERDRSLNPPVAQLLRLPFKRQRLPGQNPCDLYLGTAMAQRTVISGLIMR